MNGPIQYLDITADIIDRFFSPEEASFDMEAIVDNETNPEDQLSILKVVTSSMVDLTGCSPDEALRDVSEEVTTILEGNSLNNVALCAWNSALERLNESYQQAA